MKRLSGIDPAADDGVRRATTWPIPGPGWTPRPQCRGVEPSSPACHCSADSTEPPVLPPTLGRSGPASTTRPCPTPASATPSCPSPRAAARSPRPGPAGGSWRATVTTRRRSCSSIGDPTPGSCWSSPSLARLFSRKHDQLRHTSALTKFKINFVFATAPALAAPSAAAPSFPRSTSLGLSEPASLSMTGVLRTEGRLVAAVAESGLKGLHHFKFAF
jgi:hypothetical protein